jgi:hypothetical protein
MTKKLKKCIVCKEPILVGIPYLRFTRLIQVEKDDGSIVERVSGLQVCIHEEHLKKPGG